MRDKVKKGLLLSVTGFLFGVIFTGIVYRFFPQYLCYAVYGVSESDLYQKEELEMRPGMRLTECFVPQNRYLMKISVGAVRGDSDGVLIGRLSDGQGKVLEECQFALPDLVYEFPFQTWVEPGQQYQLDILASEKNQSAVRIVLGPEDSGAAEHVSSYADGRAVDRVPAIGYIYGTYSRKLLAFWFIVFFLGGFMIGETVLYKLKM